MFSLITLYLNEYEETFIKKNIKVIFSGDVSKLPVSSLYAIDKIRHKTKDNHKYIINFCLNYGSTYEIINAVKKISSDVKNNLVSINDIDDKLFKNYLYSKELPDIDLLIRTSNEKRLSNFMLYQLSYSELYFCKKLWPDFNSKDIDKAFIDYSNRDRRYGGIVK